MPTQAHARSSRPRTSPPSRLRLAIRPVTPELWPALEDLFGKSGASNGCWCMYWRIGGGYREHKEENRDALRSVVRQGPPPGLLAFDGDVAVGWCQVTPRRALPYLDGFTRFGPLDARPVWSVSCFFVRRSHRRRGVCTALLAAAVRLAREAGAPAVEAYPSTKDPGWYTGFAAAFEKAGFRKVGGRPPDRPVMRREFRAARRA
ncbi:MAG TPA: GNAT family N-acetyltransferase [Myxococcaceae bacterium]